MNDKEAIHPNGDLTDDNNSNIEDYETQHMWINQNNSFYTFVENILQSSPKLEDQNKTNDWRTTNKLEAELVMAYNNNARSNTLYPRTFYALYIGPNDNGASHLIFKMSTKQILTTLKYKLVPMSEDLIEAINKMDTFTTSI